MKKKKVTKAEQKKLLSKSKKHDFEFILEEYPSINNNIFISQDLWNQLCKNLFILNHEDYTVDQLFDLYDKLTKFGILYHINFTDNIIE